jgi:hypothetical protein
MLFRLRPLGLTAIFLLIAACPSTHISNVSGTVVDAISGDPVKNAVVIASVVGHTRARDTWFLVHSRFAESRCFRSVVRTDEDGAFRIRDRELNGYFGESYWSLKVFQSGFRSRVGGYRVNDPSHVLLQIWPESHAEEFNAYSGGRVDYARTDNPKGLREDQRNLALYLDEWLSNGQLLPPCEFEDDDAARGKLVMDVYRQWLSLGGPSLNHGRSLACGAFASFELNDADAKERAELLALRKQVNHACTAGKEEI